MTEGANMFHGSDNAEKYRQHTNFVYNEDNTHEVLKLLDPRPGDIILDVGCGSGELTATIHNIVASGFNSTTQERGYMYGIDRSTDMIHAAKKDNSLHGPRYDVCDGHDLVAWLHRHDLVGKFDKVFSNAALHWMKASPSTVIQGMSAALKSSGILAIEMGGHLNCIGVRSALNTALKARGIDSDKVNPWYFPTAQSYSKKIQQVGLILESASLYPRMTPLPLESGLRGWLETFAGPFINVLKTDKEREEVLKEVMEEAKVDMYDAETDQWTLMYVRLRVRARKG